MKMQFHNNNNNPDTTHVVHTHHQVQPQMPTYNYYNNQYPLFRYPNANVYGYPNANPYGHGHSYGNPYGHPMYGNGPMRMREMDILSRVYLGGVGLVGLLILYNLMDK
jgi:hypothetical protein